MSDDNCKEIISFSELADEMARDENQDFIDYKDEEDETLRGIFEDQRKGYIKELRKKFVEIIEVKDGKIEDYKNERGHYIIPINQKPMIKIWLKEYTSSVVKKIRDKKDNDAEPEEVLAFLEKMHKSIENDNDISEEVKEKNISQINEMNKYFGNKAAIEATPKLESIIEETMREVILSGNGSLRGLFDKDYEALIFLYKEMIIYSKKMWEIIVSGCIEYRECELHEDIMEITNEGIKDYDTIDNPEMKRDNPLDMIEEIIRDEIDFQEKDYSDPIKSEIIEAIQLYKEKYESDFNR